MAATIDKESNCDHLEEEGKNKKPEDQLNTSSWKEKHKQTDGTVTQQQNQTNINEAITKPTNTKTVQGYNNGEEGNLVSIKSRRTTQKDEQLPGFSGSANSDEMGDKMDKKSETEDNSVNVKPSKDGNVTICSSHDHLTKEEKGEVKNFPHDNLTEEEKGGVKKFPHDNLTEEEQGEATSSSHDKLTEEYKGEATSSSHDYLTEEEQCAATSCSHNKLTEQYKGEATIASHDKLTKEQKGESISSSQDNLTEEDKGDAISSSQDSLTEEEKGEAISLHYAFAQTDVTLRMPDNLPAEESNFLRFCHLIQKVAPQAVRHIFDQVFPPVDLEGIIQRNMAVLRDLFRKRVITYPQWKLICPSGTAPSSSTFDLTTMVCLFRHLTNTSTNSGFNDILPPPSDVSLGADLSRLKYYRNNIAHDLVKDRKIDNKDFPIIWDTASMAISRIGGPLYEQECSSLRTANLDTSYIDIYREFLVKERDLQQKVSGLTQSHKEYGKQITELTESYQQLQKEHEHDKKEIKKLQTKLKDPVPEHERENVRLMTEKWEANKHLFIETSAATQLNTVMKRQSIAIVTGSHGSGKTFTVQNVLLSMREDGYDVIPVRSSSDLVRYFSRSARQVFFLDNLCGKHNISNSDIEEWDRNRDRLVDEIFTNSSTKCIFVCRLQIFLDPKFQNLKLKEFKVINLSGADRLTLEEKQSIGQIHIGKSIMKQMTDQTIVNCICFPLLCSLYNKQDKHKMNTTAYFEKPKHVFEIELTELRERPDKTKYGCIALCVLLNNKVDPDFFSSTNKKGVKMARVVFEKLGVNVPPMKAIQSCFDSMVGSFFKKETRMILFFPLFKTAGYKSIHDYMFDVYCVHVSKTMINMIIRYGDSKLICDRALLQSIGECNENAILIPNKLEQHFLKRILRDLSSCRVSDVFDSSQMKYDSYRSKIIKCLTLIDFDVNVRDEYCRTRICQASEAGYVDVVEMLCKKGANVNQSNNYGSTPLTAASGRGHIDVIELLYNKGADINLRDEGGWTPLTAASRKGHIDVVELLCNKGADVNLCDQHGSTPLTAASREGHNGVVELLCNKNADVNQKDEFGWTPLTAASFGGHIDVVKLLCNNCADANLRDKFGSTPLTAASGEGHIDVVRLLCNNGADANLRDEFGWTPLTTASKRGHIDVVELLCKRGDDVNLI